LTKAGREAFAEMAVAHEEWVTDLFSGLSTNQQSQLHTLLGAMKKNLQKQEETS
jgi:DNA-binding MarR family transcriptional regulator